MKQPSPAKSVARDGEIRLGTEHAKQVGSRYLTRLKPGQPGIFMLLAVINSASELCVPVPICNAPTSTAMVFYLPSESLKPLLLSHVRTKLPMSRIMRING